MSKIKNIRAREILDSRGNPTIETRVELADGVTAISSVPSGSSVGKYEAMEVRDKDPERFNGMGVLKAVTNVNEIIAPKLRGLEARNQLEVDKTMILLDGTTNKSKLGANAILSVSQAVCKAAAGCEKVSVFEHVSHLYGIKKDELLLPTPIFNLINGGKHGAGNLDFQEFHIIPAQEKKFSQSLQMGEEIYQSLKKVLIKHGAAYSVGDEGGYAPNLFTNIDALDALVKAIGQTKYVLQKDVFLGLDIAPAYFYKEGSYKIKDRTVSMDSYEMIEYFRELNQQYHLFSLEDPLIEDDWDGWSRIVAVLPFTMVVGDDLLVTNKLRCLEAIKRKACNAILVKPIQVGTVAEAIEVIKICRKAGWKIVVSHRSGETNDDFIADFAVGVKADFTKFGAPARGERVAKYNRLLGIERELNL